MTSSPEVPRPLAESAADAGDMEPTTSASNGFNAYIFTRMRTQTDTFNQDRI